MRLGLGNRVPGVDTRDFKDLCQPGLVLRQGVQARGGRGGGKVES